MLGTRGFAQPTCCLCFARLLTAMLRLARTIVAPLPSILFPGAVIPDSRYRESLPIGVIPDIFYRESIWGFFQRDTCHRHAGMTNGG